VNSTRARCLVTLLVVTATVALAGCGEQPPERERDQRAQQEQPPPNPASARFRLRIGNLLPLSGELAPFGPPARKAAGLAVEEARDALRRDDIEGVEVDLVQEDTRTNPRGAEAAARQLIERRSTCLIGPWASAETIPVAQSVTVPEQVPLISPASTSSQITTLVDDGLVFRTAPSNTLQGEALADVVEEELGGVERPVSVGGRNDAYGQALAQSFRRAWEAKGGRLTSAPTLYDPRQPDLRDEAERIVSGDPAAYVIADFPDTFARLGRELVATGDFRASRLFVTDGLAGPAVAEQVPRRAIAGAHGVRPGTPEEGDAAEAFDRRYTRSDLNPDRRQTFDAQNFDAAMLCFLAAVAAGSNQGQAIQSKLRDVSGPPGTPVTFEDLPEAIRLLRRGQDIDYQGASGPINLDRQGDPTVGTFEVFEYGRNGRFTVDRQIEAQIGGEEPQGEGQGDRGSHRR
jgi:ABC-type branched-subunit amino acid transport system substrate-binding protein